MSETGNESTSISQLRQKSVEGIGMTPDQARARLEGMGFTQDMWGEISGKKGGSHFTRALIHIAQGDSARNLSDVYKEMFPEENPVGPTNVTPSKVITSSPTIVNRNSK